MGRKRILDRRTFVRDSRGGRRGLHHRATRTCWARRSRRPRDKLNIACIGGGGMGAATSMAIATENVYALCDVDWRMAQDAFRDYPKAKRYQDYREMLEKERQDIDAVTVSTPDHSHAAAAMLALKMGKHVYSQKPLARTIGEVRALRPRPRGNTRSPPRWATRGTRTRGRA